jgi:2-keto-4-pentenoate hydratase/2-oxohepta-3-ene-1,7-dioic acid hydratase in catechol pathway
MRLVSYDAGGVWRSGLQIGDAVADTHEVAMMAGWSEPERCGLHATRAVLALEPARLRALEEVISSRHAELLASEVLAARSGLRLGPPVPDPPKIICLGLNYRDHAREAGLNEPTAPMFFAKWANSLIGPADAIVPPTGATQTMDYEAELAVVIGTRARDVDAERALDYVAGAMAFNDVSDRELQMANNLWTGGKAMDTYGPCGPALITLDEIDDLQALGVRTRVNGEVVQDGTTAEMIFGVAEVIGRLSRIMTLEPGDIIATGTPAGVGNSRDPQLFLRPGDVVEVEIDQIGVLCNPVAEPLASNHFSRNRSATNG